MPVISSYSKPISFCTVSQAWIPAAEINFALAMLVRHMTKVPYAKPSISSFKLVDDRGGTGHFWLRVDTEEVTPAQLNAILGKGFDVSLEDE